MVDMNPWERTASAPDTWKSVPDYPLTFEPLYQSRVWGGRALEARYGRALPPGPTGESWELVDRPGAVSVVANGPLRGMDLHRLWTGHPRLFGPAAGCSSRFPLLIKLLDCHDRLSVQVHPDDAAARRLGGEAKTELWVFLEVAPGAEVFAGLKRGVTRDRFEAALEAGGAEIVSLLHRLEPRPGDVMRVPAGRLHAIGAGNLLCEIQQSSDTTWRIYDWDRRGLDGRPRPLHRLESLESIHFQDLEPAFEPTGACGPFDSGCFIVERMEIDAPTGFGAPGRFSVGVVISGAVDMAGERVDTGRCWLLPAGLGGTALTPLEPGTQVLKVDLPAEAGS